MSSTQVRFMTLLREQDESQSFLVNTWRTKPSEDLLS